MNNKLGSFAGNLHLSLRILQLVNINSFNSGFVSNFVQIIQVKFQNMSSLLFRLTIALIVTLYRNIILSVNFERRKFYEIFFVDLKSRRIQQD